MDAGSDGGWGSSAIYFTQANEFLFAASTCLVVCWSQREIY